MTQTNTPLATAPHEAPVLDPVVSRYRRPGTFYALATAIPWAVWLLAGHLSRLPDQTPTTSVAIAALGLTGLAAPIVVAAALVARDPVVRRDVAHRLVNVREAPAWVWVLSVALLPGALLVATALSVPLGYSPDQFLPRGGASFTTGAVPALLTLTLAPVLEELAWHSYGTDALASRWSVWRSSWVFAVVWGLWHLPLATITGNYQADVVDTGWLASVNFLASLFPFVLIMNWLYYRGGRTIWVAVVFHLVANVGNELLLTHPDTKAIQTGLLFLVCTAIVWHDRALFFTRPPRAT